MPGLGLRAQQVSGVPCFCAPNNVWVEREGGERKRGARVREGEGLCLRGEGGRREREEGEGRERVWEERGMGEGAVLHGIAR